MDSLGLTVEKFCWNSLGSLYILPFFDRLSEFAFILEFISLDLPVGGKLSFWKDLLPSPLALRPLLEATDAFFTPRAKLCRIYPPPALTQPPFTYPVLPLKPAAFLARWGSPTACRVPQRPHILTGEWLMVSLTVGFKLLPVFLRPSISPGYSRYADLRFGNLTGDFFFSLPLSLLFCLNLFFILIKPPPWLFRVLLLY